MSLAGPHCPEDFALADTMHDYWTAFAKTGDPNRHGADGVPHWPVYEHGGSARMMALDTGGAAIAIRDLDVWAGRAWGLDVWAGCQCHLTVCMVLWACWIFLVSRKMLKSFLFVLCLRLLGVYV